MVLKPHIFLTKFYLNNGSFYCFKFTLLITFVIVHRIGRTGRRGKTGVATTFINQDCSEQILLDLKHLLREAKQKVPPFLQAIEDPTEAFQQIEGADQGCSYCGGLGHRLANCPKFDLDRRTELGNLKEKYSSGRGIGGGGDDY
jgi:ATP-dependent RNA helicase DDX41